METYPFLQQKKTEMQLLLASKSPRRRELLSSLGFPLRIVDVDVEETIGSEIPASEVAEQLAILKSGGYNSQLLVNGDILVTADTVVVCDKQVMGKPHSRQEAYEMLQSLSGREHQVYTGVCLRSKDLQISFAEKTDVWFRNLSEEEIFYYIDTYKPFDKAGAYGIQEWIGMVGIERIEGCYYNVMGLPVARLCKELTKFI